MNQINWPFSDTIAGYITVADTQLGTFTIKTPGGTEFSGKVTSATFGEFVHNLGGHYKDAMDSLDTLMVPGTYMFAYGVFYPEDGDNKFEAKHLVFPGKAPQDFCFEKPNWWIEQASEIANFQLDAQFEGGPIDFSKYRTNLFLNGDKLPSGIQETDTISRTVYGFASAYLLTGDDRFLEAAEKGTKYLQEKIAKRDKEGVVYWLHALEITPDGNKEHLGSLFGDDYGALPAYEQIYALAGPIQTYRITGDPSILSDAEKTIELFNQYYFDSSELGGYYSHITTNTFDPKDESLGHNQARKNWNSVGDHAPAYLINLYLATGREEFADFLEYTFDTIENRFPATDGSPFVQEKFFDDWTADKTWGWQQDRAVAGHDLKIAWNLMRMNSLRPKDKYVDLATKLADTMPEVGMDKQRGGWYDVAERHLGEGETFHRLAFHDRKAWWQQEQGILAYLILNGCLEKDEYRKLAQESAAFYNAWFLDTDTGGVYFNVLANGLPYLLGNERNKGSHSMGAYHSIELCYLAAVYTNLLITKQPMDFHFKPKIGGLKDDILRVAPDLLPPGSIKIESVTIDGEDYTDFDAEALTVKLPSSSGMSHQKMLERRRAGGLRMEHIQTDLKVKVRIAPVTPAI
ncbi:AGE family epimerase/isomerase [Luteolibacter sp. AS25]|uniref:AGE family epimerase/isomerase n=1 Tax=Luteolibacter sp. AS25 TaxID=3135776 RepID=UPI00398A61D0